MPANVINDFMRLFVTVGEHMEVLMKNLSVKMQLALAFGVLTALMVGMSLFGALGLRGANERFNDYVNGEARRAELAIDVRVYANRRAIAVRDMVLVDTAAERDAEKTKAVDAHQQLQSSLRGLKDAVSRASNVSLQERTLVDQLEDIEARYAPVALDIVRLASEDQRDQAIRKMNEECRPLLRQLIATAKDTVELTRTLTARKSEAGASSSSSASFFM